MFSKACEYAIRAVVYIASEASFPEKKGIAEICEQIDAPQHFTAKILQELVRQGLISSQKGVNGGFYLTPQQRRQPLYNVVSAIDGEKIFTGCGLGLRQCSESKPCPIHNQFRDIRNRLGRMMRETTIELLASRLQRGESVLLG